MSDIVMGWVGVIFFFILFLVCLCMLCAYFASDLATKYNKEINKAAKKMISGNGKKVSENVRKRCEWCKYNISCNYYEPFCDIKENWVSDTDECPLKKNKNTDSRKDGEGEKEDVKSSNENRKEIV